MPPEPAPPTNPAKPPVTAATVEVPVEWLNEPLKYAYDADKCAATVPCGEEPGVHDPACHDALLPELTKGQFVAGSEANAHSAIWTYLYARADMGLDHEDALTLAVDEAAEVAACFAGIGSCHGGGCKHG